MEKYFNLSFTKQRALLADFCRALIILNTEEEAIKFLVDLLTKEEVIKLAKRIEIARLLLEGKEYRQIVDALNVSQGTIAKVARWLREGGDGFKLVFKRTKTKKQKLKPETNFDMAIREWKRFKRRYPSMFWPSLLIESIIESADKKQREKIFESFKKLDRKSKIYKEISQLLKSDFQK